MAGGEKRLNILHFYSNPSLRTDKIPMLFSGELHHLLKIGKKKSYSTGKIVLTLKPLVM